MRLARAAVFAVVSSLACANGTVDVPDPPKAEVGVISGVVTSAVTGLPVAGAFIAVAVPRAYGCRCQAEDSTDASGRYRLAGLAQGAYTLSFTRSGYVSGQKGVFVYEDDSLRVDLVLQPFGAGR
ncbi:MAG TPA: carboxypeptidase-like regulatory domain-containing protein [Gemmatimonadaceae bacterium]|nr:carboxypeptidase-like regulatory domain-containing protein [Gemmatimonadaceae bacterium]